MLNWVEHEICFITSGQGISSSFPVSKDGPRYYKTGYSLAQIKGSRISREYIVQYKFWVQLFKASLA